LFLLILLSITHKGDPFFKQPRPGKDERIFNILKFKTMTDSCDESGNLLSDQERLTSLGRFIRKSSLDEIPQLLNVLAGQMSLVGPRPLLVDYLLLYNDYQKQRHLALPGVSGWAQINGRNTISWEEKFDFDVWYVNNCSFLLDLKILLITFFNVIQGKGVSQNGHVSMGRFEGTKEVKSKISN
jgi:lipopolysaccharide/colanic/teichoic acid biosynthesis glycosyltransferase